MPNVHMPNGGCSKEPRGMRGTRRGWAGGCSFRQEAPAEAGERGPKARLAHRGRALWAQGTAAGKAAEKGGSSECSGNSQEDSYLTLPAAPDPYSPEVELKAPRLAQGHRRRASILPSILAESPGTGREQSAEGVRRRAGVSPRRPWDLGPTALLVSPNDPTAGGQGCLLYAPPTDQGGGQRRGRGARCREATWSFSGDRKLLPGQV